MLKLMDFSYKKLVFISLLTILNILRVEACGGSLHQDSGIIRSPGFPGTRYPDNLNCVWNIIATPNRKIMVNITHLDIEHKTDCGYDRLSIWDVENISSLIGVFCGNKTKSLIQTNSSTLQIIFKTDARTTGYGFEIYFKSFAAEKPPTTPGGIQQISRVIEAKNKLSNWLMSHRKSNAETTNRWGLQAHRIATAFYLNNEYLLPSHPDYKIKDELRYEITIQVLDKLSNKDKFSTQGIATFMNGLLVTCLNPRDFHGHDLVSELRRRVEAESYTNPVVILALCNANDSMTLKDIDRLELAFSTRKNRPLWFDTQAITVLALNCIMRKNEALVNETSILQSSMIQELIANQAKNGTVGSLKDTALVLQALIAANSTNKTFNVEAAIDSILSMQKTDGSFGSFLNSYYILPVFNSKSLVDIGDIICQAPKRNEIEVLDHLKRRKGKMLKTLLSVLIGSDTDLGKTWSLKVSENSSFYDVIELISSMDSKLNVEYNVSDDKPYVTAVSGIEEDPELGLYWFTYVKVKNSSLNAVLVEKSPADIIIEGNQELILWYKEGNE